MSTQRAQRTVIVSQGGRSGVGGVVLQGDKASEELVKLIPPDLLTPPEVKTVDAVAATPPAEVPKLVAAAATESVPPPPPPPAPIAPELVPVPGSRKELGKIRERDMVVRLAQQIGVTVTESMDERLVREAIIRRLNLP